MTASRAQMWTVSEINELKRMWSESVLSAAGIGAQMGYSRNAVLGKVHRLGLPSRGRQGRKAIPRAAGRPRVIAPPVFRAAPYVPPDEPVSLDLTLMQIEPGQCRWVHGDGPFLFCGHPTHKASSYCEHHWHRSVDHTLRRNRAPKFFTWDKLGVAA